MESKYKIGDRVRVKSIDWYNNNKDKFGNIVLGGIRPIFTHYMSRCCGQVMTIVGIDSEYGDYTMKEDNGDYSWDAEMFEGVVNPDNLNVYGVLDSPMVDDIGIDDSEPDNIDKCIQRLDGNECKIALPEGYQFADRQGNIVDTSIIIVKKKGIEYPKTFEECVHVLEGENRMSLEQMNTFRKLIDARNAYWKIAGEEMGLGKPWEPDWKNDEQFKYIIICRRGCIIKDTYTAKDVVLAFPTEELRDMFYERFKSEIELCKELI